jgi:hypothetical protein
MQEKFVSYTEELNAIDYFEKTAIYLSSIRNNIQDWKWVFISLHGAIYALAIIVARGTNDVSVLQGNRVIGTRDALKKCVEKGALSNEDIERECLGRLIKEFRGGFEHYAPGVWSIQESGLRKITKCVFDVACKLLNSHSHFHYEIGENKRLELALNKIEKELRMF